MTLWAIMLVKDEADVIEPVLRHIAAQGVTGIIVADNDSSDDTPNILDDLIGNIGCDLMWQHDPIVGYWQSRKMTALAREAHEVYGARWIWPVDADELWYYGDTRSLADVISGADGDVIYARLWHHFPTAVDLTDGNPFQRMTYRGHEAPIGKVILRWQPGMVIEAGNHDAEGSYAPSTLRDVQVRHFPYRSEEQFIRKALNGARAMQAAEAIPWHTCQHWREFGVLHERGGDAALVEAYQRHFYYDLPSAAGLVYDPARLDA
jgi:Glycosyl transferase family 2